MSVIFNCDSFSRIVYNYRVEYPHNTAPIANLVTGDKLDLSGCIDNARVLLWVRDRAAQHLSPQVTNCATQNVITTLYKKPQASHLQEFHKEAVAACSK